MERQRLGAPHDMRLIHTSDIHLDTSFATPGMPVGYGNRRRQALRDVFHTIMARAKTWPADAVLIAGDLFEIGRVSRDTVAFLQAEFESIAPVRVFIGPGNHDPYVPYSPYAREAWPDNVAIFREPTWEFLELSTVPLTVHGFGFDGPDISRNPFGRLVVPQDGRTHVAVAHGSEMGCLPPEKGAYAPFAVSEAAVEGLIYVALGHYHCMKTFETLAGTRLVYSGAPEGHGFREPGVLCYIEAEIEGDDVRLTPVASSQSVYAVHELDCTKFTTAHHVVEAIRALAHGDGRSSIARITLTGLCADAWHGEAPAIRDAVMSEFEFLDLIDRLERQEDYDALAREETSLGVFVRRMSDEIRFTADVHKREVLERAREVGVAAYRGRDLPVREAERG